MIEHLLRNATPFEIAWAVPAFIASVVWVVILYLVAGDAVFWHSDRAKEEAKGRDIKPETIWSGGQLAQKSILLLVLVIMTAFGLVAMFSPPSVKPPPPPTRVTYMLTFTFISIPTLLMLYGVIYLYSRKRTNQADDERTANHRRRRTDLDHGEVIVEQLNKERPT